MTSCYTPCCLFSGTNILETKYLQLKTWQMQTVLQFRKLRNRRLQDTSENNYAMGQFLKHILCTFTSAILVS